MSHNDPWLLCSVQEMHSHCLNFTKYFNRRLGILATGLRSSSTIFHSCAVMWCVWFYQLVGKQGVEHMCSSMQRQYDNIAVDIKSNQDYQHHKRLVFQQCMRWSPIIFTNYSTGVDFTSEWILHLILHLTFWVILYANMLVINYISALEYANNVSHYPTNWWLNYNEIDNLLLIHRSCLWSM